MVTATLSFPRRPSGLLLAALIGLAAHGASPAATGPIVLRVDASDAPRRVFHASMSIPLDASMLNAGRVTLCYPKWIPGEHGPTGPINDAAGVAFSAGGKPLSWRRDPENMHAFHVDVPAGAAAIDASLDYLSPADADGFTSGASATANLAVVSWNTLILYPSGARSDDVTVAPSITLPRGWGFATALEPSGAAPGGDATLQPVAFKPVSLTTLVDSPLACSRHARRVDLTPGATPAHTLAILADSAAALQISPEREAAHRALIPEALAIFGARHYTSYTFLLTLSDNVAHFGLEHHQSSDNRNAERALIDADAFRKYAGLLPHEYVHSWCGKHRRPAGLATGDFESPMKGEMLWVYEGLTTYLGHILSARAGFLTPDDWREYYAFVAANLDTRPGRTWRPLQDTADAAQNLYNSRGDAWDSWRRGTDFYDESSLIWLEADTIIREKSGGARSLDDFCRVFLGAPGASSGVAEGRTDPAGRAPTVLPFAFDDVVAALEHVSPYDWRTFLLDRLNAKGPGAPLGGLRASGWTLDYTPEPNWWENERDEQGKKTLDLRFCLGLKLGEDGATLDAVPGSPAYAAGIGPGMRVVAVNGRKYTHDVMRDALRAGATGIECIVDNAGFFSVLAVPYTGGERHPHLVRDSSRPDVLGAIIAPRASAPRAK